MAAPTVVQVMQGIATRLATITGLNVTAFKPSQINPPHAYVSIPEIDYHITFAHGGMDFRPTVTIVVPFALDRVDQPTLAAYADTSGAQSIHHVIEADSSLGGLDGVDCEVEHFIENDITIGGIDWPAGIFTLHVLARGGS